MSIFYLEEHTACSNYVSDYNIGFKCCNVAHGEYFTSLGKDYNCLIFILNGNANLHYESYDYPVKKDTVCFIPLSSGFEIQANTDISFIIHHFNKPVDLCERLALENLSSQTINKLHVPVLRINPALKKFLTTLNFYMEEGVFCKHFHEIKHKELLFIFRFFYTKDEVARLFAPIISKNLDFRNLVLTNYIRANSVKELANICNYSLSSFNRFFKKNFNENPYTWLQNQKLKYIVGKLSDKNVPLIQIVDEYGFSSAAHFTVFCKKHLNQTPSQFRKQHIARSV
jgi:AraC-like DNA-binding protein